MKDIMFYLSKATTLCEAIDMLLDALNSDFKETQDLAIKERISALEYYKKCIFNKTLISTHRSEFNGLYSALDKEIPEMTFSLDGNKKSFKSFWEKIDMLQSEHRSIDSVNDIHRFRLITTTSNVDTEENINELYLATLVTIKYFLSKGYILCTPRPLKDTGFRQRKGVFVPQKSLIPEIYSQRVKDYVAKPKKNGYQSIHLMFEKQENKFEVQLRTFAMHVRAEYENAAHEKFKQSTRTVKKWDLSKINISGFKYVEIRDPETNEIVINELLDNVGIIEPVQTFVRRKTF